MRFKALLLLFCFSIFLSCSDSSGSDDTVTPSDEGEVIIDQEGEEPDDDDDNDDVCSIEGDISISTLAELEDFEATYGDCTLLKGNLSISIPDGGSTDAFSALKEVEGFIQIFNISDTVNLSGLQNIEKIGWFLQIEGVQTTNPEFFSGLKEVVGNVTIFASDISGVNLFPSLEIIGGTFRMEQNRSLTEFNGLNNVTSLGGSVEIQANELDIIYVFDKLEGEVESILLNNNQVRSIKGFNGDFSAKGALNLVNYQIFEEVEGFNGLEFVGLGLRLESQSNEQQGTVRINGFNSLARVDGFLNIRNIKALDGFHSLQSVGRSFEISTHLPEGFSGFEKLSQVEIFDVSLSETAIDYPELFPALRVIELNYTFNYQGDQDLSGFGDLSEVGRDLSLVLSNGGESLDGFSNLTNVGGRLSLFSKFTSLENFSSLLFVEGLNLSNNSNLNSLSDLNDNLVINSYLRVVDNPNLSACSIDAVCNYLTGSGTISILNNGSGCNDV